MTPRARKIPAPTTAWFSRLAEERQREDGAEPVRARHLDDVDDGLHDVVHDVVHDGLHDGLRDVVHDGLDDIVR